MQMLGMQLCLSRKMQQVRGTRSCQQQSAHLQPIHAKPTDPVNLLQEEFEKESPALIPLSFLRQCLDWDVRASTGLLIGLSLFHTSSADCISPTVPGKYTC